MKGLSKLFTRFIKDEEGATVVEYAVLIALIITACVVIIGGVGLKVEKGLQQFNNKFSPE